MSTCRDGNKQIFPLAFGVSDDKSKASWYWFLTKLKGVIREVEELVIVSNRHLVIDEVMPNVFPHVVHVSCIHYISKNMLAE